MSVRAKIILICILAFLFLSISVVAATKFLSYKVNAFVLNLSDKISEEIGHTVLIDKVNIKWDMLFLKVNIKNIQILEKDNNFPLFMAQEIVSTVDTLHSVRSFGLKFKQLLLRSPRLVMQMNEHNMPVILGLGNSDVIGNVDPTAILKILAMQRHILIENGDLHLQGSDEADLPFMDLRIDFSQNADKEYSMIARGNIAAAIAPEFVLAVRYFGDIADYEHAMFDFSIKTSNIQLLNLINFIPQFRKYLIAGDFSDFDVKGIVQNGTLREITSDFSISELAFADTHINGGVGHVEYRPGENKSSLQLARVKLSNDNFFSQPITIDALSTDLVYILNEEGYDVALENARVKFLDLELLPSMQASFVDNKLIYLEFNSTQQAQLRKLLSILPDKKFAPNFNEWLKRAIVDGDLSKTSLKYRDQKLSWSLDFKNAELKFAPLWPSIHNIDATLVMDNGKLSINAHQAMIQGVPLKTLTSKYEEYDGKPYTFITVDGGVQTSVVDALEYIRRTPLYESVGANLEPFNPSGNMDMMLRFVINVGKPEISVDVDGAFRLQDGQLDLPEIKSKAKNINGVIKFANNHIHSEELKLNIFATNARARLKTKADKQALNINLAMPLSVSTLRDIFPELDLTKFQGASNILVDIDLPLKDGQHRNMQLSTDMVGIGINYPAPFAKAFDTKMPLKIQYVTHHKNGDSLKFNYDSLLNGVLFYKDKMLHGGRISINKPLDKSTQTENLIINGEIKQLDWADWETLVVKSSKKGGLPIELDLAINSLKFADTEYKPVRMKYSSANSSLFLDTEMLTGTIIAKLEDERLDVKLDKLNIPKSRIKNNALVDFLAEKRRQNKLPLIQFRCKVLKFNEQKFRSVHLDLLPRTYGYEITNFSITNENIHLQAQGRWQMDNSGNTTLSGNIFTQNFGKVLAEWGYENSISRGRGEMNFSVNWDGGPVDFDVLKLEGASHLDLRSGSLTNVNPGIGRIIGLLSLESIHRRLQFDFSDILSKGFAFDKFIADFKIEPGSIKSDNILINSPSAKIELFGKTGIQTHDLDFTMFVTPKVGASIPIAAAIAAGPAVGAAIWLFDKASGSKISEITKYKYKVTGTWDSPQVNEVSNADKVVG